MFLFQICDVFKGQYGREPTVDEVKGILTRLKEAQDGDQLEDDDSEDEDFECADDDDDDDDDDDGDDDGSDADMEEAQF